MPEPADPRDFLALANRHDFVKGAVARVDLDDPGLKTLLDELARSAKFRGVFWRLGDSIPRGLADLQQRRLALDLQLKPAQFPPAIEMARRFPELRMAIVHLGSPDVGGTASDDWANGMAVLARHRQVVCKASDLIHLSLGRWSGAELRPYLQHVLAEFSPARVMFGSGWPSGLPDHIWKETLAAFTQAIGPQKMEVREELLGGAAARFYGVEAMIP